MTQNRTMLPPSERYKLFITAPLAASAASSVSEGCHSCEEPLDSQESGDGYDDLNNTDRGGNGDISDGHAHKISDTGNTDENDIGNMNYERSSSNSDNEAEEEIILSLCLQTTTINDNSTIATSSNAVNTNFCNINNAPDSYVNIDASIDTSMHNIFDKVDPHFLSSLPDDVLNEMLFFETQNREMQRIELEMDRKRRRRILSMENGSGGGNAKQQEQQIQSEQ